MQMDQISKSKKESKKTSGKACECFQSITINLETRREKSDKLDHIHILNVLKIIIKRQNLGEVFAMCFEIV